jgi:hypothetical protein
VIRPALPHDQAPEHALLRGIGHGWRRALLSFCRDPRDRSEIDREFRMVDRKQISVALSVLFDTGWLGHVEDTVRLDPLRPLAVRDLVQQLFGVTSLDAGEPVDDLVDASITGLCRNSYRSVLKELADAELCSTELMARTGLTQTEVRYACRTWRRVGALSMTRDDSFTVGHRWRRTGVVLPALGGFLNRLEVS